MPRWWILLFLLRLGWTLIGQDGYIHPDEFFQSTEVIAGDILNLEVYRPWEFNSSFPVRSIVLPYALCAPVFCLLKILQSWTGPGVKLINTYTILVLPRFVITTLGGATDYMVFKMGGSESLLLYATSYVTLVYYTRTLSNTLESFLFTSLLFIIISDKNLQNMKCAMKAVRKLAQEIRKTDGPNDDVSDPTDDLDCEVSTPIHQVVLTAGVLVAGFFNRPTFLIFAFAPYVFWLFSSCGRNDHHIMMHTMDRITHSFLMAILLSAIFIAFDSRYFGSLNMYTVADIASFGDIDEMMRVLKSLSITPLNFILYNINPKNLAEHGLHPRSNHFLVNAPMLFGILSLFIFYSIGKTVEQKIGLIHSSRWAIANKTGKFLMFSYFVPIILLSVFPHQEPRFLIPLLTPLAILYGKRVFGWTSWSGWKIIWIVTNLMAALFYGTLHQGGLIPCLAHLQKTLPLSQAKYENNHIIFYHTYMPPRHLLTIPRLDDINSTRHSGLIRVHDLKGSHFNEVSYLVEKILKQTLPSEISNVYIVSPATLDDHFCDNKFGYSFKLERHFTKHLSMEDPPRFPDDLICPNGHQDSCNRLCNSSLAQKLQKTFSLFLYRVDMENFNEGLITASYRY